MAEERPLGADVSPKAAGEGWPRSTLRFEPREISLSLAKASPYGPFSWLPAEFPARDAALGA